MKSISHPFETGLARKAITGVLATIIIFAALFTIGAGFLVFQNQTNLSATQANSNRESAIQQSSLEKLSMSVSPPVAGTLTLNLHNKGGVPTTIVGAFVTSSTGALQSPPGIMSSPCNQNTLNIGSSSTCPLSSYTYPGGGISVYLSVITSRGNTFTIAYPTPSLITTTTVSTTVTTVSSSTLPYIGIGSNALVIDMVAEPPVAYTCISGCVVVNVTLYNYQTTGALSSVTLDPNPPTYTLCTANTPGCTATLTSCSLSGTTCTPATPPNPPSTCSGPFSSSKPHSGTSNTIPVYSGSGVAPHIFYLCYYNAKTGVVGGFATFQGEATAMLGTTPIASALTTSNAIKIGGSANVLNQGPFSANFFFFAYSACTAVNGGGACTSETPGFSGNPDTNTSDLPNGYLIGGNSYYVAYYIQVSNNFNVTLPILQYSFFQTDSTLGNDADFFIVGPTSTTGTYYPAYCTALPSTPCSPTLTAYTGSAFACNPALGGSITNCIDVSPGKTVTLTMAACNYGSNSWDWYDQSDGSNEGGGTIGCTINGATTNTPSYTPTEATWLGIIIFFVYNGQVYAQQIPFAGDLVCTNVATC